MIAIKNPAKLALQNIYKDFQNTTRNYKGDFKGLFRKKQEKVFQQLLAEGAKKRKINHKLIGEDMMDDDTKNELQLVTSY